MTAAEKDSLEDQSLALAQATALLTFIYRARESDPNVNDGLAGIVRILLSARDRLDELLNP
jgi:hypothetical protein